MVKRPDRNAREQRQLRRDYEARQAVHAGQVRRKVRDNWIIAIATVLVCGSAIFAQYAYFNWGPGSPAPSATPTPGDSATPTPGATTGSSLGTVKRDDSLTAPSVDLSTTPPTVVLPPASVPAPTQLVVKVLEEGSGAVVTDSQTVTVDYHGVNWTTAAVFDSSYVRGQPASFALSGVIAGFKQAIAGQHIGSTIIATIPSSLAYGDSSGDPNTSGTLVFVIHIISAQ